MILKELGERELAINDAMTEKEYLNHVKSLAKLNDLFDCYIGQGYYGTDTPSVILRNVDIIAAGEVGGGRSRGGQVAEGLFLLSPAAF